MKTLHVIAKGNSWTVEGSSNSNTFRTKEQALLEAYKIAKSENGSVIVHSRDGRVMSVNNNFEKFSGRKLFSANVKGTLNRKEIRNTIAEIIYTSSHSQE